MNQIIHFKENTGSALILVIILLLALTTGSMLLLQGAYLHKKAVIESDHDLQAFYYAEAGIYKALWLLGGHDGKGPAWRPAREEITLMEDQPAWITIQDWGGYIKVTSEVEYRQTQKRIVVLAGQRPPTEFDYAIVLGEYGYPLVVHGKNRIVGDVRVGMKGVEAGTIRGRGFTGRRFVEGRTERVNNPQIPVFDARQLQNEKQRLMSLLQTSPQNEDVLRGDVIIDTAFVRIHPEQHIHVMGNIIVQHDLNVPLFQHPVQISCTNNIRILNAKNLGNALTFAAGETISIENSHLTDALFYAQTKIIATGRNEFSGQLFCDQILHIADQSVLLYPSLLYSEGILADQKLQGDIFLSDQSELNGMIVLNTMAHHGTQIRNDTRLEISEQASLMGFVYSDHYTLHLGTVYGGIMTEAFYLYVSPTTYLNWLRDAVTDRTRLPASFCIPLAFGEKQVFDIIKYENIESYYPEKMNPVHLKENPYEPLFEIPTA